MAAREQFHGYTVEHGVPHGQWKTIRKPDGTILGKAWSMPGVKRMIYKDAGLHVCACGHTPANHHNGVGAGCIMRDAKTGDRCSCRRSPREATAEMNYRRNFYPNIGAH